MSRAQFGFSFWIALVGIFLLFGAPFVTLPGAIHVAIANASERSGAPHQEINIELFDECLNAIQTFLPEQEMEQPIDLELLCPEVLGDVRNNPVLASQKHLMESPENQSKLSKIQLMDIRHLFYQAMPPMLPEGASWNAEPQRLEEIIEDTFIPYHKNDASSWWKSFIEWLKGKINTEQEVSYDWLEEFLSFVAELSEYLLIIVYICFGLAALFLAWLIFNELKLAGYFRSYDKGGRQANHNTTDSNIMVAKYIRLSLDEISQLPLQQQPEALLNYCIEHLIRHRQLPANRSLTHRELLPQLANFKAFQSFKELVTIVETAAYAGKQLSPEALQSSYEYQLEITRVNQ